AFGTENIGLDRESMGDRIEFALKATGTDKFRESTASRLSGGQKQRVAIAGVLAVKPRILILDESTSMLDPRGREEVMEVVRRLNKEENMTVITITHYMDEVVDCDRVAVLIGGRIEKIGTPEEIFSDNDLLDKAGLEPPIPMKIAQRLSKMGIPVPTPLKKEDLLESLLKLLKG
ncbi:MAG: ATP-binding cassette domain-containing protein, partial [Clostridia bacterium]|nr:ATP-binding cassette domain-containing protein [Clostridia bacterium]